MEYIDAVYHIVKTNSEGMDAIYADYIEQLVGKHGFDTLIESGLLERCGVLNCRRLYVLLERPTNKEVSRA